MLISASMERETISGRDGLLHAAEELERSTVRRELALVLLGVLAVPVGIAALWPGLLSAGDRLFADIGFGIVLGVTLVAWVVERRWAARVRRALAAGVDLDEDGRGDGGAEPTPRA